MSRPLPLAGLAAAVTTAATAVVFAAATATVAGSLAGCVPSSEDPPAATGDSDSDPAVLYDRSLILIERGRVDEAIQTLDEALRLDPDSPQLLTQRGIAYERAGRLDRAMTDYAAAIGVDPAYPPALNNRAAMLGRRREFDAAIADLEASVAADPKQPLAWRNLALAKIDSGRIDEAGSDLDIAAQLDPEDAETVRLLGLVQRHRKDYVRARQLFEEAIGLDSRNAAAHADLGRTLLLMDRPKEAVAALQQALRYDGALPLDSTLTAAEESAVMAGFVASSGDYTGYSMPTAGPRMALLKGPGPATHAMVVIPDNRGRLLIEQERLKILQNQPQPVLVVAARGGRASRVIDAKSLTEAQLRPVLLQVLPKKPE